MKLAGELKFPPIVDRSCSISVGSVLEQRHADFKALPTARSKRSVFNRYTGSSRRTVQEASVSVWVMYSQIRIRMETPHSTPTPLRSFNRSEALAFHPIYASLKKLLMK